MRNGEWGKGNGERGMGNGEIEMEKNKNLKWQIKNVSMVNEK